MRSRDPIFVGSNIRVRNLARAVRFYRALGLRFAGRGRMEDGTTLVWLRDRTTGQLLELAHLSPRSPLYSPFRRPTGHNHTWTFSLLSVSTLLPKVRRMGARMLFDFEEGDIRLTFVSDPDGTVVELLSWTDAARGRHRDPPLLRLATPRRGLRLRDGHST